MNREWVGIFQDLEEALVDQVLERLAEAESLPVKCLVLGRDMPLLAALCEQWSGRVEIVPVFAQGATGDWSDLLETIALNEGVDIGATIWVDQEQIRGAGPSAPIRMHCSSDDVARLCASSIASALRSLSCPGR
jgi:hypothetical protein